MTPTTKASLSAEVFTRNVSLGVDGILYDFGEDDARLATPFDEAFVVKDDLNFWTVRGRLTYFSKSGS